MVEKKEKRYVSDNAQLMAEWNWEKNSDTEPAQLTFGSHKKVWWVCSKGHEWQARIDHRHTGIGCPYCAGQRVLKGFNDLQTINPILVQEWNYEKNSNLNPEDFTISSSRKVWWICSKGHEWQATIAHRNSERGCPYCAGQRVLKGFNDLQTVNSTLAKEWNYEKNNGLTPADVLPNSHKKVWWVCSKGHEWQTTVSHRTEGTGCPICNSENNTSFPEYAIVFYLKKHGLEAIHSHKEYGYELDIFVPSKKIAIEYDGFFWHKNRINQDLEKNRKCAKDGIKLYRIREGLPPLQEGSTDYLLRKNQKNYSDTLEAILSEIVGYRVNVDLKRDAFFIENCRVYMEKEKSILSSNADIAKEWNYEKNGKLMPEHVMPNSDKKVWWKCAKGHEWQATVGNRNKNHGCPYCAGLKVLKGENDLKTVNPSLAQEWNYEKNNGLLPTDVKPNSNKMVWWRCMQGHEWQAFIYNRNRGSGCPICAKQKRKSSK